MTGKTDLESLIQLVKTLKTLGVPTQLNIVLNISLEPPSIEKKQESQQIGDYPLLNGCILHVSEAVAQLLSHPWAKEGRTFSEIMAALKANGFDIPKSTLSGVLKWMVETNRIRRVKEKRYARELWVYYGGEANG